MKDQTNKLTKNDQKYYDLLKKEYPAIYSNAILSSECICINHRLKLSTCADIERTFVLFALDIINKFREEE